MRMKRHKVQKARRSGTATASPLPWRFFFLMIISACIMAAGFFFAARQHFTTMDLGLKNSKMRKQLEDLESERRRLILAREVSISPSEITRVAHTIGLREQIETPQPTTIKEVKAPTDSDSVKPVLTTLRQPDQPEIARENEKEIKKPVKGLVPQTTAKQTPVIETKKLVKPVVQQAAVKQTVNERPRVVVDSDKRIAQTATKPASKFR